MSAVEPGERAQALLREADAAYRDGAWLKVNAAAGLARAYLEAAQLDRYERSKRRAAPPQQRRMEEDLQRLGQPQWVSVPRPDGVE